MRVSATGATVSVADAVTLAYVAEMDKLVREETAFAEIGNVAEVPPAGTVTVAATEAAAGFELASDTTAPPAGAGESRITRFPTEVPVPTIVDGPSVTVSEDTGDHAFSTFAERYEDAHTSTQGSSVKLVAIDCDHGAAAVWRWKCR
jgi:hypothetical protein